MHTVSRIEVVLGGHAARGEAPEKLLVLLHKLRVGDDGMALQQLAKVVGERRAHEEEEEQEPVVEDLGIPERRATHQGRRPPLPGVGAGALVAHLAVVGEEAIGPPPIAPELLHDHQVVVLIPLLGHVNDPQFRSPTPPAQGFVKVVRRHETASRGDATRVRGSHPFARRPKVGRAAHTK